MSGIPFWEDSPDVYDTVVIGQLKMPGIATVDVVLEEAVDTKKPQGGAGAVTTFEGPMPAKVEITLTMYAKDQWDLFQQRAPLWRPRAGKDRTAFDISHPHVNAWGISSVLIVKMAGPKVGPVPGTRVVAFSCVEFTPLPKKSGPTTPKSTGGSSLANLYDEKNKIGPPAPPSPGASFAKAKP